MQNFLLEAALMLFLITCTLIIILNRDVLTCIIIYSAFSFSAVLLYFMMGSPDVAFTEAVIGVISSIYLITALRKLDRWCK